MNSLQQYIDLYEANREAIESRSSQVLNAARSEALAIVKEGRLPHRGDENYERTDVNDMMAPDYGVNINRVPLPADIAASFRCEVPNMSTLLGVVVNDAFHPTRTLVDRLPEGVTFMSLDKASRDYPELVDRYYTKIAPKEDVSVALNTLLVQDGVMIHVARGVKLDKPLQLVNIFSAGAPLMAVRRVLVVMEENASAQLLVCDHTQDWEGSYLSSEVVEVSLSRGAEFHYYNIEESSDKTTRRWQMFVKQNERSTLVADGITLSCGTTRNDFDVTVEGNRCETRLGGMAIASGEQKVDNNVMVRHLSTHSLSQQLFKYVLWDKATGAFGGRILVAPGAEYTDAHQTNRNLLASHDARMHSKPQLEIYNDEVKCSHGATTGQLDGEALFYMRTRGIPESEARNMLMQAFMADVIDSVTMEGLRDRLRHLVEKRFSGTESFCGGCRASEGCASIVK